jgi:DNA-binding NtrC family response regulator
MSDHAAEKRATILVVEDELAILNLVFNVLSNAGYEVLMANSVATARKRWHAQHEKIDVLLTDWSLSVGPPAEFISQILFDNPTTKVVIMSGYVAHTFDLSKGRLFFLEKPFSIHSLLSTIESLVLSRQQ